MSRKPANRKEWRNFHVTRGELLDKWFPRLIQERISPIERELLFLSLPFSQRCWIRFRNWSDRELTWPPREPWWWPERLSWSRREEEQPDIEGGEAS